MYYMATTVRSVRLTDEVLDTVKQKLGLDPDTGSSDVIKVAVETIASQK